jgi:hypothetical protein
MVKRCAWCGKFLGHVVPLENGATTHGICDFCLEEVKRELEEEKCLKT